MRKPGIGCRRFDLPDAFGGKGREMIAKSLIDFGVFFCVIGCAAVSYTHLSTLTIVNDGDIPAMQDQIQQWIKEKQDGTESERRIPQ